MFVCEKRKTNIYLLIAQDLTLDETIKLFARKHSGWLSQRACMVGALELVMYRMCERSI